MLKISSHFCHWLNKAPQYHFKVTLISHGLTIAENCKNYEDCKNFYGGYTICDREGTYILGYGYCAGK